MHLEHLYPLGREDFGLCDCTFSTSPDQTSAVGLDTLVDDPNPTDPRPRSQSLPIVPEDSALRTTRASSDGDIITPKQNKRLNRKLPPKLTESLEVLALDPASRSPLPPSPVFTVSSLPSSAAMPTSPVMQRWTPSPTSSSLRTPTSSIRHYPSSPHDSCSSGSASLCGTWSSVDVSSPKKRETRKERKARKQAEKDAFDIDSPPSLRDLYQASILDVIAEDGTRVKFGDLVRRGRTIVIFIRHWFCPLCAQYVQSIVREVTPVALEEADVELIIIGNGSDKMLPAYKNKAMKCPYRMYTDPTLGVYRALGLTRQTGDAGPDEEAGDYLVQTPLEATVSTIKRATQMPLRNPGHFTQLGGEFIFDGTLNAIYTHRMSTTRAHAPIRDVCASAGVRLEWVHYEPGSPPPLVHRHSINDVEPLAIRSEDDWMMRRDREMERISALKENRRSGIAKDSIKAKRREIRIVGVDEEDGEIDMFARHFGQVRFA